MDPLEKIYNLERRLKMKKIIFSILLGSSILSNGVYGSDADIEDQDQSHLKRKRGENDAPPSTLIPDQKRLRGEITRNPRSEADAEIRSHLNSIIFFQGASLPCSEKGELYLQLLSKNQILTDKDFHQLFRIEYSRLQSLNPSALKEIQKLFYDEENFFYELRNSENKQKSRMVLSFGLWNYYHNQDLHALICTDSTNLGQFYFAQYAMEHFNLAPDYPHLLNMVEHSEASSDISYFSRP